MQDISRRQVLLGTASAAAALAASSLLTGCTSAEEQAFLNDIATFCNELPPFTAIAVVIVSSIPDIAAGATLAETLGQTATNVCNAVLKDLTTIIDNITNAGGTATVTVNSNANEAQQARGIPFSRVVKAFKKHAAKMASRHPTRASQSVVRTNSDSNPTTAAIGPFTFAPAQ